MIIEIFFSFIAIFSLSVVIIHYAKLYRENTGLEVKNRWIININQPWDLTKGRLNDSALFYKLDQIKMHIKNNFPEVLNVCKQTNYSCPYAPGMSSSCEDYKEKSVCYNVSPADPDFAATFNMKMTEGRWFLPEDELSEIKVITINKKLKQELFGKEPAAGKTIYVGKPQTYPIKIVGVFEAIKRRGEFTEEPNFLFESGSGKENRYRHYDGLVMQLASNVNKDFEPRLVKDLMSFDRTFEYRVEKLEQMRKQYILSELAPIIIIGAIVLFLVVNVMLGLFGTLWLNIARRKPEIGLRRAVGSTGRTIQRQILGETYILAIVSILIGFIFTSQMFIYNFFDTPVATLVRANLLAFGIIIALCTISAYAPAKLAASLEPAVALHED